MGNIRVKLYEPVVQEGMSFQEDCTRTNSHHTSSPCAFGSGELKSESNYQ